MHQHPRRNVLQVIEKRQRQHDRAELVEEKNRAEAAHRARKRPRRRIVAEAHRQPRRRQPQKRSEQHRMQVPLRQRKAHIEFLLLACVSAGCSPGWSRSLSSSVMFLLRCRPALALFLLRANEPQQRVQREEAQHAPQQQIHEQPHEVQRRIQLAIVRIGVRLILHKARIRVRMASPAGLDQVRLCSPATPDRTPAESRALHGNPSTAPSPHTRPAVPVASGTCPDRSPAGPCGTIRRSASTACGTSPSVGCRIACAVWQSVQTGTFMLPAASALPCTPPRYSSFTPPWHAPQVFGDIRPVSRALRVLVAQNVVRPVAAHAVRRHQQPFFAHRVAMDRIHVDRVDILQAVLLRQRLVRMAGAAGLRNIQRIHRRLGSSLGKIACAFAVAAGAGMRARLGMNAAGNRLRLVGMAGRALHRHRLVRMRILFDRGVAIAAAQAAVNARVKLFASTPTFLPEASCRVLSAWHDRQSASFASITRGKLNSSSATSPASSILPRPPNLDHLNSFGCLAAPAKNRPKTSLRPA